MELILHIGAEKTGTTSLQYFLAANRERLRQQGILFPASAGENNHKVLSLVAQADPGSDRMRQIKKIQLDLKEDLEKELSAGRYDRAVMSSEFCASRLVTDAAVQNLHDFLFQIFSDVKVVVYIRRQDEFLLSIYSTGVKTGRTTPLGIPRNSGGRFDHWELLARWARVFGRDHIVCRKFEAESLKNANIIDDFVELVEIEETSSFERPPSQNKKLDAECAEFLRIFNSYSTDTTVEGVNKPGGLASLLGEISNGPPVSFAPRRLAAFMETFRESNKKVALEYFNGADRPGADDPLFAPRTNSTTPHDPILTVERAVEIAAHLWQTSRMRMRAVSRSHKRKAIEQSQRRQAFDRQRTR